ncbi:MATE family efflux transporter [Amedibacterium intestinale]|uniref:MATE family efflux transporter n=1 Tax=Amedibacterium intestinale TaxID=2583452 RepID=UPI0022E69855|nr:MATE family efflux transporter [Amedibacterium intestinale]
MKNMTEGNVTKLIINFAIPVLLGNIFQQFYTMADTMMVGKILGVQALAAMGATSALSNLMIGLISGIAMGVTILIAQYYGAKDEEGMKTSTAGCILLCIGSTVLIVLVSMVLKSPLLTLLQTPQSIFMDADNYLSVIFLGLFITMAYNMMASMMRSIGDSKTPLYFLIIASLSNVGIGLYFSGIFSYGNLRCCICDRIGTRFKCSVMLFLHAKKISHVCVKEERFPYRKRIAASSVVYGNFYGSYEFYCIHRFCCFAKCGKSAWRNYDCGPYSS